MWDPEGGHCSPSSAAAAPRRGSFSTPHTPQYLTPPGPTVRSRGSACRCPVGATTAPPRRRRSTASTPKGLPDLLATDIGCQFAWHLVLVSTQLPFGHSCGGYVCALNPK